MSNLDQSFNIDPNNPMGYTSNSNDLNNSNNSTNRIKTGENQKSNKRFNYLVSLQKKHVVAGSCVIMFMFLVFFIMGFFFGYQSSEKPTNMYTEASPKQSLSEEASTFAINNAPINAESKINFTQRIASDELLKKDNPLSSPTRSKEKKKKRNRVTTKSPKSKLVDITPIAGKDYYYIQVITTSFVDRAKNIYVEFKKRNYPVKVKKAQKSGKEIYQIRLGLYENKARALRHLKQAKNAAGFKEATLIRYRF